MIDCINSLPLKYIVKELHGFVLTSWLIIILLIRRCAIMCSLLLTKVLVCPPEKLLITNKCTVKDFLLHKV